MGYTHVTLPMADARQLLAALCDGSGVTLREMQTGLDLENSAITTLANAMNKVIHADKLLPSRNRTLHIRHRIPDSESGYIHQRIPITEKAAMHLEATRLCILDVSEGDYDLKLGLQEEWHREEVTLLLLAIIPPPT
jgi:hypothetical protein